MNMLVERGPVPFQSANDSIADLVSETCENQVHDLAAQPAQETEFADFEAYEMLRKEACSFHAMEWNVTQLDVAAKIGLGPPRSL